MTLVLCIIMITSYVIFYFDLDKVSLGKKCASLDLVKLIHVKLISTVEDVIISTVRCKSNLGFESLKIYIKTRPPHCIPSGNFAPLALEE